MADAMHDQPYEPIARKAITLDTEAADCRCCGAEATPTRPVFTAAIYDTDGEYYSRLCGSCFDEVERDIVKSYDPTSGVHDFAREKRFLAQIGHQLLDVGPDDELQVFVDDLLPAKARAADAERRVA